MRISRANPPGRRAVSHALRISQDKMETESENGSVGDDSVFWLDSEGTTQLTDGEEEEREESFR